MIANSTELNIINALQNCRFGKRYVFKMDPLNLSELQVWWIYKLGYMYRRQINNEQMKWICAQYLEDHTKPPTKRELLKESKQKAKQEQIKPGQLSISIRQLSINLK